MQALVIAIQGLNSQLIAFRDRLAEWSLFWYP